MPISSHVALPSQEGGAVQVRAGMAGGVPAHKEFRFLLPALQLLMPYAGAAVAQLVDALRASMQGCESQQTAACAGAADEASLSKGHASGGAVADELRAGMPRADSAEGDDHDAAGKVACSILSQQPTAGSNMLPGPVRRSAARSREEAAAADDAVARLVDLRRQPERRKRRGRRWRLILAAAAIVLCLGAQLLAAIYFCLVHQRCGMQNLVSCWLLDAGPCLLVLLPSAKLLCIVIHDPIRSLTLSS